MKAGGDGHRRDRVWEKGTEEGVREDTTRIENLGNNVETYCSGNVLECLRVTLVKSPSNGQYRSLTRPPSQTSQGFHFGAGTPKERQNFSPAQPLLPEGYAGAMGAHKL